MVNQMIEYAYAIYDGDQLAVMDYRVRIFWNRNTAIDNCPGGFKVKKIKICPVHSNKSNDGASK